MMSLLNIQIYWKTTTISKLKNDIALNFLSRVLIKSKPIMLEFFGPLKQPIIMAPYHVKVRLLKLKNDAKTIYQMFNKKFRESFLWSF